VEYDKLVIDVGVKTNTFGIPSIQEGNIIFFIKVLQQARGIRNNIVDSYEKATVPTVSEAERRRHAHPSYTVKNHLILKEPAFGAAFESS
jgi:NADH dehydrogenase FAD-containing subunit